MHVYGEEEWVRYPVRIHRSAAYKSDDGNIERQDDGNLLSEIEAQQHAQTAGICISRIGYQALNYT